MEGAPASNIALEQSKVRLEQLGYFAEVEYETAEVPGTSDQIDVDFSVAEQLSGQIGGSIGYGQVQGLVLSANLQQSNFLGTGKSIGVGVNTSLFQTNYQFNYFDPYYTIVVLLSYGLLHLTAQRTQRCEARHLDLLHSPRRKSGGDDVFDSFSSLSLSLSLSIWPHLSASAYVCKRVCLRVCVTCEHGG